MNDEKKPREWILCYGEYDDPAWNGPLFDGRVKVIEKSAYDELQKKLDIATIALKRLKKELLFFEVEDLDLMIMEALKKISGEK